MSSDFTEVHTLKEKIEKANTTQAIEYQAMRLEMEALREKFNDYRKQTGAKFELMVSMITEQQNSTVVNLTMHIDKLALNQKVTEVHNDPKSQLQQTLHEKQARRWN